MNNNTDKGRTKDTSSLAGRVCVVTGAGSGIGRGIALALAKEGARVAALDLNADGASATVAEIKSHGGQAAAFTCDTSDAASVAGAAGQSAAALGSRKFCKSESTNGLARFRALPTELQPLSCDIGWQDSNLRQRCNLDRQSIRVQVATKLWCRQFY